MIALLCPGQGAQKPGMLTPWLDEPATASSLDEFSAAADIDLRELGTTADAETIKDTALAQPLIVAASLLSLGRLTSELGPVHQWAGITAGHSVGEFAAAAVAGVISPERAVQLVAVRGRAMADAAALTPTSMAAVVGGEAAEVSEALAGFGLTEANVNGGGQVVAAGTTDQLAALAENPPARVRVIPLAVAGAFHTQHMATATGPVADALQATDSADPQITLLSNADGAAVPDAQTVTDRLVSQITSPVRWDLCQETLRTEGVQLAIELAPGGVLTGLARRTLPGVQSVAIKSPQDIPTALDAVRAHQEQP